MANVTNPQEGIAAFLRVRFPILSRVASPKLRAAVFLAFLYLLGLAHWAFVFAFAEFKSLDWDLTAIYHSVLRDALTHGEIPYLMSYTRHYTDRFLGSPETPLSPQFALLPFLTDAGFHRLNIALMYTIGCCGLFSLRKRWALGALPFTFLFLLFQFNGYIVSHLAVGHTMWYGYFFLPFLHGIVLDMIEKPYSERSCLLLAFVLFLIELQGSFHLFVAWAIYLACVGLFIPRLFAPLLYAGICACALCLFRFLPAAVSCQHTGLDFVSGFPSLSHLANALTQLRDFRAEYAGGRYGLAWWELDCYVGIIGVAVLIGFCALGWKRERTEARTALRGLHFAGLVMLALSFGGIFKVLHDTGFPPLLSQRIPSRLIIVPLTLWMIIATRHMQRWLSGETPKDLAARLFLLVCLCLLAGELSSHSAAWRVRDVDLYFSNRHVYGDTHAFVRPVPWDDPGMRRYVILVWTSAAASMASAVFCAVRFFRARPSINGDSAPQR